MRVLALDTSTEYLSLALWLDGEILLRETQAGQRHSELTLPMLQVLLVESGVTLNSLDGIAFGQGPGSFTGIRIACGIVQGLAAGVDLPVVGVSTLLALAAQSDQERVIACLDARMREIYHASYQRQGEDWQEIQAPGLYALEVVPSAAGTGWHGIGSGFLVDNAALAQHYAASVSTIWSDRVPHAREIAKLGARALAQGQGVAAWDAAPLYIRDKVALKTCER